MVDIDNIRHQLFVMKFTNQLEYLQKNTTEEDNEWKDETIMQLNTIIDKYVVKKKKKITKREQMSMDIDKYVYMKEWHRLQNGHRMKLIDDYLEKKYTDPLKSDLRSRFEKLVSVGKLNRKKHVIYDRSITEITSIPALKITDGKITLKH